MVWGDFKISTARSRPLKGYLTTHPPEQGGEFDITRLPHDGNRLFDFEPSPLARRSTSNPPPRPFLLLRVA